VKPWRVLLTRPEEESAALASELAAAGYFATSLPLLAIEPLALNPGQQRLLAQLRDYAALIVVSKPAARLLLQRLHEQAMALPDQPWFSVGAATGCLLRAAGASVQWPVAGEDSEALLALPALQQALRLPAARVLIVRGEGGRELLAESLRACGVEVDYLQLYQRVLPEYPQGTLAGRIAAERLNALVVSSGQGFEHLHRLAGAAWPALSGLPLFVPSQRVAEQARAAGAQQVLDCRGANAAALLTALRESPMPTFKGTSCASATAPMQRMDT
jgi:uroporphyrinogen-III synthase